jgi:REP element-mobilizing transposase RayT
LGDVVGIFKSISTHQYAINVNANNWPAFPGKLWQRNYYERIIRNDDELNRIREYISNNPLHWDNDENNPANLKDFK